jgi:hypothetical protein
VNYIFKKEKPVIQLGDFITGIGQAGNKEKKFRVRALLKGNFDVMKKKNSRFMNFYRRRKRSISRK